MKVACCVLRGLPFSNEGWLLDDLAYAITIHKSQGSEFSAVIIPVFVGTRKAMTMAIKQQDMSLRQTLELLIKNDNLVVESSIETL